MTIFLVAGNLRHAKVSAQKWGWAQRFKARWMTPAGDEDKQRVARIFPNLKYQNDRGELAEAWVSESHRQEVWWWLLLGLVGLLCGEVWMTRRLVRNR